MPRQFFLACDVRGRYLLQVGASNLCAATRKTPAMLVPGMRSPHEAVLYRASLKHRIRPTTKAAAQRAADPGPARRRRPR
jgi:hypothetical protein